MNRDRWVAGVHRGTWGGFGGRGGEEIEGFDRSRPQCRGPFGQRHGPRTSCADSKFIPLKADWPTIEHQSQSKATQN